MEYQVCRGVSYAEWATSCRGGMAGACWLHETTDEREVCGQWKTSEQDAYASFYTTLERATDCGAPGMRCISATPVGETEVRTRESGALKAVGAGEKSVGDSILEVVRTILKSLQISH